MGVPADDAEMTAYNLNLTLHNVMMLTPMWKGLEGRLREQADILRLALGLVAAGRLTVRPAATFALADAAKAQLYLESGKAIGKVTLGMR
jgi:NADPH:quinone reductase